MSNRLLNRLVLAGAATAVIAAAPAAASAASTFCVHQPASSCPAGAADEGTDIASAFADAGNTPSTSADPNRIVIGSGTFQVPAFRALLYQSSNPVKITGAGETQTSVTGSPSRPDPALIALGGGGQPGDVSISDLTISAATDAIPDVELSQNATGDHLRLISSASSSVGAALQGGTLSTSTISLPGTAVYTAGSATSEIDDTVIDAGVGFSLTGPANIHRVSVKDSDWGVYAWGVAVYIDDSLIVSSGSGGMLAIDENHEGSINALNDTIVGTSGSGVGAEATDVGAGSDAEVQMINSIVTGFPQSFVSDPEGGGFTLITLIDDDYDGQVIGPNSSVSNAMVATPQFVDAAAGDYRLPASSRLIDFSSMTSVGPSSTTDLDGNPRVVAVNRADTPVDLGAYEYQPPAQTTTTPTTTTSTTTSTTSTTSTTPTSSTTTPTSSTTSTTPTPTTPSSPRGGSHTTTPPARVATLAMIGKPRARGRRIVMSLRCSGSGTCAGVRVTATVGARRIAVAATGLKAGHGRTITLTLNGAGRRLLTRRGRARVTVAVSYLHAGRRAALRHTTVVLRVAKR